MRFAMGVNGTKVQIRRENYAWHSRRLMRLWLPDMHSQQETSKNHNRTRFKDMDVAQPWTLQPPTQWGFSMGNSHSYHELKQNQLCSKLFGRSINYPLHQSAIHRCHAVCVSICGKAVAWSMIVTKCSVTQRSRTPAQNIGCTVYFDCGFNSTWSRCIPGLK